MRIALLSDHGPGSGRETVLSAIATHGPPDLQFTAHVGRRGLPALSPGEILDRMEYERADVLHLATTGPLAIAALHVAWRMQVPVVGSFDTTLARATKIHAAYFRALCRRCERLLVPSWLARARMVDASIAPDALVRWRPGVDAAIFAPSKRSACLREQWQVSESRPAVVHVGCLSDPHAVRRLVSLEAALHRSNPMHRLIVVGDGPARAELEARCSRAMFMGTVAHRRVPEILASADLLVSPGDEDSAALGVLEAQASGLPCVVMESGSAAEHVTVASGIVCGSVVDLIVGAASIVRDHARRKEMGRAAREHSVRQDWASGLAPLYAGYRSVVELSGDRRDLRPALVSQGRRF